MEAPRQAAFSRDALAARAPIVREASYAVNARVRPFMLFWIGRDNVGEARVTWREGSGTRAFEILIGSDPARAPRRINRWGFVVEELKPDRTEILGVMKGSDEETMEEVEAQIARHDSISTFRASRTTIVGRRAQSGTMAVQAPAHLTYRNLDELLALLPTQPSRIRTLDLPAGTQTGFLVALDSIIRSSVDPCRAARGVDASQVPVVTYLYNQTLFDLSLSSCKLEPELQTTTGTVADVVDARLQVRNRTTRNQTKFRLSFGTSGELRALPVRAVFRPRWWMEVELVLDPPAAR